MDVVATEVLGRLDEPARGVRPMRRHFDFDARAGAALRVEEPRVRAALVDDPLAVGRRVPRIEVRVVRMAPQILAARSARIEIADAFEVREEPDAVRQPHRAGDVSLEAGKPLELALARRID